MTDNKLESLPPDAVMRAACFTDHHENQWYYVEHLWRDITLNITIDKTTLEYETFILDEYIGQPIQYMSLPLGETLSQVIDRSIAGLNAQGIKISHDHERYKHG